MSSISALFMHRLRTARTQLDPVIPPGEFAAIVGVTRDRLRQIETRCYEPFLDEAHRCAMVLGTAGILPLIATGASLADLDLGVPLPSDIDMLHANVRLPLSLACRIALKLGLPDPALLIQRPIDRMVWTLTLERSGGICPICRQTLVGEHGHTASCLGDALYGLRDQPRASVGALPLPHAPGKARRASGPGLGVRLAREARDMQQKALAEAIDMDPAYLSKIELGKLPLTLDKARQIAQVLSCDEAILFVNPAPEVSKSDYRAGVYGGSTDA